MRIATIFLLLVVGLLSPLAELESSPGSQPASRFYLGGIQVNEPDHQRWVDTLGAVGMNTVEVTLYAHQGDWDSDHLWFADEAPAVVDEIKQAKAAGLNVVLVLRVAVDHAYPRNQFVWHGMIMPRSEPAIRSWFEKYTRFAVKWARIADELDIDVLAVGSEMKALVATLPISRFGDAKNFYGYNWYQRTLRRRALEFADQIEQRHLWVRGYQNYDTLPEFLDGRYRHSQAWARQVYLRDEPGRFRKINLRRRLLNDSWIELIGEVRRVYGGKLSYAANFDHYHNVGFWRHLDLMGINSYFPLRGNINEELDAQQKLTRFTAEWEKIFDRIRRFKAGQGVAGMPVLFTEIGYTFRRHSTVEPWSHGGFSVIGWKGARRQLVVWGEQPVDYEERQLALAALSAVHRRRPGELAGLLYWKLSTIKDHERLEPFVLHIGTDSSDPLQATLAGFIRSTASNGNPPATRYH